MVNAPVKPPEDEISIHLPKLKNAELADQRFVPDGLCLMMPSIDFFSMAPKKLGIAKGVCAECTVTQECLEFSVVTEQEYGVWGGLDETERRPMIKQFQAMLKEVQAT
jgi:WhiB family redox-sensing transcriptional regulator